MVQETFPIPEGYHKEVTYKISKTVDWATPNLTVTRLRLLGGIGGAFSRNGSWQWDVSYCHGLLNGEPVNIALPFDHLPRNWKSEIIRHAKAAGIYARKLGILDNVSTLS
ncbi:hypothetical protein CMI41_01830 [Candidatus Pacearchaeota archaeon]|nr:hypothetical protein [Candidatus Pacearchaeota archaeon]|tara:strand:- start:7230 stop:7559 length:330 start_codon:yes stop_codon:yes gene_type:complete